MALSRPPLGVQLQPYDPLVDLHRCCTAHFVGDVGVYIQRGAAGDVANNGGERFDVHAMFQTCCAKYMPLWHNKDKSENPCVAREYPQKDTM